MNDDAVLQELLNNEETLVTTEPQNEPEFPFIMVATAILKDVLDSLDFTIVLMIVTTICSALLAIVLFLWVVGKLGGGWWKRRLIRWLWSRYALTILIEISPFLKIVPASTIFVLMAHYHEKKIVQLLNAALETIHDGLAKATKST